MWISRVFLFSFCILKIAQSNLFNFQNGYESRHNILISTIERASWEDCMTSCTVRSKCRSVEMVIRFRLCKLFANDTTQNGVMLKHTPGCLYSEKRTWTKETIDQRCGDNCTTAETCSMNSTVGCQIKECDHPPMLNSRSVILGTKLSVGSKILYVCTDDKSVSTPSICGADGQWTLKEFSCPKDCEGEQFQDTCYLFIDTFLNFSRAEDNCRNLGAQLVHITTNDENMFLKGQRNRSSLYHFGAFGLSRWIGLTDLDHEGLWTWYNTNEKVSFTDWYQGEVGISYEDNCAVLIQGFEEIPGWYDINCGTLRRSICEMVDLV